MAVVHVGVRVIVGVGVGVEEVRVIVGVGVGVVVEVGVELGVEVVVGIMVGQLINKSEEAYSPEEGEGGVMFEIEQGIPIPEPKGNYTKYPFPAMQVGDSFSVKCSFEDSRQRMMSIKVAFCQARKRNTLPAGMKITTRRDGDGVRCWRIA